MAFRSLQAHARAEAAIELDHHHLAEAGGVRLHGGGGQFRPVDQPASRSDGRFLDQPGFLTHESTKVPPKRFNGGTRHAGRFHFCFNGREIAHGAQSLAKGLRA
jgi:hypothetical protein